VAETVTVRCEHGALLVSLHHAPARHS
jgi:hypothetical protein